MDAITPDEARGFLSRGKLVKEQELLELRRTSMAMKLKQLSALMESRQMIGMGPDRERLAQGVRERGVKLRYSLGGTSFGIRLGSRAIDVAALHGIEPRIENPLEFARRS